MHLILGICNVKVAVDNEDDMRLFLRNSERYFDQSRIGQLINQFFALLDRHIPGKRIPFVPVHLRSRFLAYQPGFEKYREKLLEVSRFSKVESLIVDEVVRRGSFLRIKNFVDVSVTHTMNAIDWLLKSSLKDYNAIQIITENKQTYQQHMRELETDGKRRISDTVLKIANSLQEKAYTFAEKHYNDQNADKAWKELIKSELGQEVRKIQDEIVSECKKILSRFLREVWDELSYLEHSYAGSDNIASYDDFELKEILSVIGGTCISGAAAGAGLAAIALGESLLGPIGWIAAGITLAVWGLMSSEEKAEKAKAQMREQLLNSIVKIKSQLKEKLNSWFKELLEKNLKAFMNDAEAIASLLGNIANAKRTLAWELNDKQKKLGRILVEEALNRLGAVHVLDLIVDVARVPGVATMLLIKRGVTLPEHVCRELERLIDEKVLFVMDTGYRHFIISQVTGCEVSIDEKNGVAYISACKVDGETKVRINLAQQLTGLHILAEKGR